MRGARLRLVAQTLALPAVVLVIAVTCALWVLPELPDPVATRFGADRAATDFTPPGTFIAIVAVGLAVALVVRPQEEPEEPVNAETPITVGDTSLAAWFGRCRAPWIMSVLLVVAVGATALTSVTAFRNGDVMLGSAYVLLTIAVAVVMTMLLGVRVRVDAVGVHWRLLPGFPRRTIRYQSIRDVEAVDVKPGDWGGWGWRFSGKGTAIFIRGGEGLRIERTNRRTLYVTVEDAARGAELARAHLRRYRS